MKKSIAVIGTVLAAAAGMFLPLLITFITDTQSAAVYYDMTVLELPDETSETAEAQPEITAEDVIRAFKCCGGFHDVMETRRESMTLSAEQAAAEAEAFIKTLCENDAVYLNNPETLTLLRTRCIAYIANEKDAWGEEITSIRDVYAPAWMCVFACCEQNVYVVVDDYVGKVIFITTEITDDIRIKLDEDSYARFGRLLQCFVDYYKEQEIVIDDLGYDGYSDGRDAQYLCMYSGSTNKQADITAWVFNKNIVFNINATPPDNILKYGGDAVDAVDDAAAVDKNQSVFPIGFGGNFVNRALDIPPFA